MRKPKIVSFLFVFYNVPPTTAQCILRRDRLLEVEGHAEMFTLESCGVVLVLYK